MHSTTHEAQPTFESVYRGQFDFVWRSLRALGVHQGALDDAQQDVFVVVHRRLPEFEGRASIKTWVYEIVRRVAMRYRTRAARHATRHSEMPELRGKDDLDAALDSSKAAETLWSFLATLDEDRRRAFILAEFWDMPGREIAEATGANMNTIYARLRSARTELDRVALRLRAKDVGSLTQALRQKRCSDAQRRRAWAGILAAVDKPVALATGGSMVTATVGWAAVGAALGGLALTGVVTLADARPDQAPPLQNTSPAAVTAKPPQPAPQPSTPSRGVADPETPAAAPQTPSPPTLARTPASPKKNVQPKQAPPSLSDQLVRVRAIREAVRGKDRASARSQIQDYRRDFRNGSLAVEVDALEVELACRARESAANDKLEALRATRADAALVARVEKICLSKIGPQKPEGGGTPP